MQFILSFSSYFEIYTILCNHVIAEMFFIEVFKKKYGNKLNQISYCFKSCCNLVDPSHLVVFISNVSYNSDLLSCLSEPFVLVKWDYSAVDKHNKILPRKYLIFMFHFIVYRHSHWIYILIWEGMVIYFIRSTELEAKTSQFGFYFFSKQFDGLYS